MYRIFVPAVPLLLAYRDASVGASTFGLTVLECWKGLVKATSTKFFDLNTFDPNEYDANHEFICYNIDYYYENFRGILKCTYVQLGIIFMNELRTVT